MDSFWQLVVTGAVGLIAGLGGSWISASAVRKTSQETLSDNREREHAAWLRDRKQEVYVEYLNQLQTLEQTIKSGDCDLESLRLVEDDLEAIERRLTLVAPAAVLSPARRISIAVSQGCWHMAGMKADRLKIGLQRAAIISEVTPGRLLFISAAREDLGVSGPALPDEALEYIQED
jgi:hypothetical protein